MAILLLVGRFADLGGSCCVGPPLLFLLAQILQNCFAGNPLSLILQKGSCMDLRPLPLLFCHHRSLLAAASSSCWLSLLPSQAPGGGFSPFRAVSWWWGAKEEREDAPIAPRVPHTITERGSTWTDFYRCRSGRGRGGAAGQEAR